MIINSTEYERIYKIINSIVSNEGTASGVSSILFSFIGAQILKHHYDVMALPKAGLAAYQLGDSQDSKLVADENADFHCWVEVDGWLIDFMAPSFSNMNAAKEKELIIPPKMMQKELSNMVASVNDLHQSGDFYLEANNAVLMNKYSVIKDSPVFGDLADVCSHWYNKPPKGIIASMVIEDQEGELTNVPLQGERVVGSW